MVEYISWVHRWKMASLAQVRHGRRRRKWEEEARREGDFSWMRMQVL